MLVFSLSFLVAASCVLGSPTCDDYAQCGGGRTAKDVLPSTEKDLDAYCPDALSEVNCQIDLTERCPNTLLAAFRKGLIEFKNLFEKLCSKTDLRQLYLKHAPCVNKLEDKKLIENCSKEFPDNGYCENLKYSFVCARKKVVDECRSEGAGNLFDAVMKPTKVNMEMFCKSGLDFTGKNWFLPGHGKTRFLLVKT